MTWKKVRRISYVLLGAIILGPFLAFAIGWMIFKVPDAQDAAISQVATINFSDGATPVATVRPKITDANGDEVSINRTIVTLDQIPQHVRDAMLAAEDRTFYSNSGFDLSGIGRAVFNQLTGGTGGGSTITQQYIKISTGQDDFSLWRKYREVVLAVKITREQSKDKILENYLNTIYLGRGAYGIQAASQAYFGKDVKDLTVSEGAMLVGINPSPSNWDPKKNLAKAQERWEFVLNSMVETQTLTPAERATMVFPDQASWDREQADNVGVPSDDRYHIYEKVVAELNGLGISEDEIKTKGLVVTTTIDRERQVAAVDAMKDVLKDQPTNLRASLVSMDPRSGAVVAYYGGPNGLGVDYASEALRQPGSTFKPFVLAAALQGDDNIGLGSVYNGRSGQEFAGGVTVDNSEGFDCSECEVKEAMTKSINTVFYKMALDTGLQNVIDAAKQAGIPTDKFEARGGIALGDQEVHPIDMATAFGTFAADGVRHQPYFVQKVVTADGEVRFERPDPVEGERAMDPKVARNVTESMIDISQSSRIPLDSGRPVAVKTGTVQLPGSNSGENKDAWTVGYTPTLSTAVWVGTDASDAIKDAAGRNVFGRMLPGAIWQSYMREALEGTKKEEFSEFEPIGEAPGSNQVESDDGQDDDGDNDDEHNDDGDNDDEHNDDNGDGDNGDGDGDNGDGDNDGDNGDGNNDGDNGDGNNDDDEETQDFGFPGRGAAGAAGAEGGPGNDPAARLRDRVGPGGNDR
ncbi:transglycosylase domain-containing protein [Pseudonocardia humida]|uniref:Penicillin-binding protein n=1 Tax=Pseudonocardia humida TaxID=2800819 RepID=A0ABT1ABB6_9PSEU|nr:transglycosylase domain-containing protein [Pseudonocardia humida]MCO1660322.1 penicillin-binding protein [Pseudonocardia humida]